MPDSYTNTTPETLQPDGSVPPSVVPNARQAKSIFSAMQQADSYRSYKRSRVKGLIDGNPPYRQRDLDSAGRGYQCNVNWREAEAYVDTAKTPFYDITTEAPTFATVKTRFGTPEQRADWSRTITKHFHWLLQFEPCMDKRRQTSQGEMVIYGTGPLVFEDEWDWRPKDILNAQLKIPERAKSDPDEWAYCTVEIDYQPHQLYERIIHPKEAKSVGWNVDAVKKAIIEAHPASEKSAEYRNWEWHQEQLKNGCLYYDTTSRMIKTVHLFVREFPKKGESQGKISHKIFLADMDVDASEFLFEKNGRYDSWTQVIHPMYYDHGNGGMHHSVTGMGTKMFSILDYKNRLMCNTADKAFAPNLMFKPIAGGNAEDLQLQQYGEYAILNEGYDAVQVPMSSRMEEALMFNREVGTLLASNLSQYRQNLQEKSGNPLTATEIQMRAGEQARLGKTQLSRYYGQLDALYAEQYRRAVNPSYPSAAGGYERAKEFRQRCLEDGVPKQALTTIESVTATRIVGQGSEFMRQQSLEFLFGMIAPTLPERGRERLIRAVIAARAGQSSVDEFYPVHEQSTLPDEQYAWAVSQVADMKIGVPAVVTDTQNPAVFAQTFLEAGFDALGTLEQGGNPQDVANFLELDGKAIFAHLQRMEADKTREPLLRKLIIAFKKLSAAQDQLVQQITKDQQQRIQKMSELQQQWNEQNGELALRKQKQDAVLGMRWQNHIQKLRENAETHAQDLALKDATTAAEIRLNSAKTATDIRNSREKSSPDNT